MLTGLCILGHHHFNLRLQGKVPALSCSGLEAAWHFIAPVLLVMPDFQGMQKSSAGLPVLERRDNWKFWGHECLAEPVTTLAFQNVLVLICGCFFLCLVVLVVLHIFIISLSS